MIKLLNLNHMLLVRSLMPLLVVLFSVQLLKAQWLGTNPVYFNAGNVGIGTSTPGYKLQVHGNSIFGNPGSGYDFTTIDANGNLGIGTQPFTNMALSIKRYANVTAGIRFENTFPGNSSFAALQMGQDVNATGTKFLNILYASNAVVSTGIYQANGSTIYNNGNGGLTLGSKQGALRFFLGGWEDEFERMRITPEGALAIGTTALPASDAKLAVKGFIYAQKVKVTLTGWADYVFDAGYPLRPLSEVEQYIQQHHHLPEVPSTAEVEKNGLDLGDNQVILLKKIEELTLYIIEQNRKLEEQGKQLKEQAQKLEDQQTQIKRLEQIK